MAKRAARIANNNTKPVPGNGNHGSFGFTGQMAANTASPHKTPNTQFANSGSKGGAAKKASMKNNGFHG